MLFAEARFYKEAGTAGGECPWSPSGSLSGLKIVQVCDSVATFAELGLQDDITQR